MSGGHWDYLSYKLEERAAFAGNVWKLLASIEHELDWGICGDTCYECAKIRVVRALEAYFDTEATDSSNSTNLLRSREPECEKCKQYRDKQMHRKSYLSYATVQVLVHLIHHGLRMHTPIEVALMDDEQMIDDALYQKVCRELNELETSLGSEDISTICVDILTKK